MKNMNEEEKKIKQYNNRMFKTRAYNRWSKFYDFLKKKPTISEIMMATDKLVEDLRGYHYEWNASKNLEAIRFILKENGEGDAKQIISL